MTLNEAFIKNYLPIAVSLFIGLLMFLINKMIFPAVVFGFWLLYATIVKISAMVR